MSDKPPKPHRSVKGKGPKPKPEEIETEPDAWDRFGDAVDVLAKTPPKPHKKPKAEDGN